MEQYRQLELFDFPEAVNYFSLGQVDSLPLTAQKTYIDIVHFIYGGIKNAIFDKKTEAVVQKRYELDAIRGIDIFQWREEDLRFLNLNGFIKYSSDKICLNNIDNLEKMCEILKKYSKPLLSLFRHNITDKPSALVDKLLEGIYVGSTVSSKRSTQLLRPHDAKSTSSWAFCVPKCFNEALDISLSENKFNGVPFAIWTQGTNFAFRHGDVICDKPSERWSDQLKKMGYFLQIESAVPAMPPEKESQKEEDAKRKIVKTNLGYVKFKVSIPNSSKTRLDYKETRSVTQAEFVKILINGL